WSSTTVRSPRDVSPRPSIARAPTTWAACSPRCSAVRRPAPETRSTWAPAHPLDEPEAMPLSMAGRRATRAAVATMTALVIGTRAEAQPARDCSDATQLVANSGPWSGPLAATVTFHARGLSLRDALDRLGAQSGVPLAYSSDLLPLDRPVCVLADRQPLGRVLATLLEGTNVEALLVAGKVVLA